MRRISHSWKSTTTGSPIGEYSVSPGTPPRRHRCPADNASDPDPEWVVKTAKLLKLGNTLRERGKPKKDPEEKN